MEDDPDRFERLLQAHLEVNPKSWEALSKRGIDETTPLQLDFEFTAPGEAEVRSLLPVLRAETDYDVEVHSQRASENGQPRWLVVGATQPAFVTLEILDEWVMWMVATGAAEGPCAFDGWAAQPTGPVVAGESEAEAG